MEKPLKVKIHNCFWKRKVVKTIKGYDQSNKIR